MRTKGSKNTVSLPTSYERGNPAINFFLAILARSKADEVQYGWDGERCILKECDWEKCNGACWDNMWRDFQETHPPNRLNIDTLAMGWWVCEYIK